ncbi:hypothetical protein GH714_010815 [Hevea brasiliensis]|uniref:Uncharacterized protein n=1 Tax=Hevea brasiliensis TaxID=3981 RepID=A0A6A6K4M7_HEVBR|nr:hypothetical protein GH714_010815 [Hevea brasiliensis]
MDAKALAKSKRAHSLNHSKKPHSAQKSKATSGGANIAGSGNKALGKQTKEKARQSAFLRIGIVMRKNLIQSQCQSDSYLDTFPSMDDILPGEFNLGVESMLSVRGKSILLWIGDDNFLVEDETAASPEVPFLSLNLNALAEQLAKVDISARLFIEADLLPMELTGNGSKTSSLESDQMQKSETEATSTISKESIFKDFSEEKKVANQNIEVMSSGSFLDVKSPNQGLDLLSQTKNSSQDSTYSQSNALECPTEFNVSSVSEPKKLSSFEASAAEAELDMLLDSFSETKLLDSSGFSSATIPVYQKEAPISLPQLTRNNPSSSKTTPIAVKLDDVLDDLLEETSMLSNKKGSYQLTKVTAAHNETLSSSSQTVINSKVLDDFDSWLDTI